jgi:anti-sigma factor RsiW
LSCSSIQELVHGYLDGELDLTRTLEVEEHMRECKVCARAYSNHATLSSALKDDSLYYSAPDRLKHRIQSSLKKEQKSQVRPRVFGWRWATVGASLALMLLFAWGVWKFMPRSSLPAGDELLAQEIVTDHIRSLQMPGHLTDVLSSDQHTVKPWFDGKVDFAPPVKDFANQGFDLYGGRLEYLNNRSVATLVYHRRLHYINLYIWPSGQTDSAAEVTTQRQGYNMVHWTTSGMNYWAISDLNSAELHELARLVQQEQ